MQGSYLQDWLLFSTDWNWRLEPGLGGTLRAVGDVGSHWLDLMTFITGLRVEEVYADFKTFHPTRKKPAKPLDTFTGKILQPSDYIEQPIYTEDYASILLHYENGWVQLPTQQRLPAGGLPFTRVCADTTTFSPFVVATRVNRAPTVDAGLNQTLEATSPAGAVAIVSSEQNRAIAV